MAPKGYDRVMIETEIGRNRKLRRHLKPAERWAYVCIICIAAEAPERGVFAVGDHPADEHDVADIADVPVSVAKKTLSKLRELGMLVHDDEIECERLYGFEERNPPPRKDTTGAERQRRFRERRKGARNGSVTPLSTVTRNGRNGVTERDVTAASHPDNAPEVEGERGRRIA